VLGIAPSATEFEINTHGHLELHSLDTELRHHFRLLARRDRTVEAVVHLQERNDAFAPYRTHPQRGVSCGGALDQCIQGIVRIGSIELSLAEPFMIRIIKSTLGFFTLAWPSTFFPFAARCPQIEMPGVI